MGRKNKKKKNKTWNRVLSAFFYSPEDLEEESLDLIEDEDIPLNTPVPRQDLFDDSEPDSGSVDAQGNLIHLFSDDAVDFSEEQDFEDVDKLVWDNGERVVENYGSLLEEADRNGNLPDTDDNPPASRPVEPLPEEIDLFEEDEDSVPEHRFSGRTRIFKTQKKTPSAVRVNINETKVIKAVEEAQKKNKEQDEKEEAEHQAQKEARRNKIKNFFKRFALNLVFIIFILICVGAALYYTFLLSDIIVVGNKNYSTDYIVENSGLKLGQHLFFTDLDSVKTKLEEDPYLQVDDVTYIFPSRVRIDITERQEAAAIIGLDYNVIIDENGYVLSMSGGSTVSSLLQVSGISMTGFQKGQRIGDTSDFATSTLITLIGKLKEYELSDYVTSLDMTTPLAIAMYSGSGFKIFIGQPTDLDAKFSALKSLLPRFQASGIGTGTLYLSAKNGVVYSPPNAAATNTITGSLGEPTEPSVTPEPVYDEDGNLIETPEQNSASTPAPTPEPVTPSPVPIQPGGGDEFQG